MNKKGESTNGNQRSARMEELSVQDEADQKTKLYVKKNENRI